ncbi:MAG: hypothetical protein Q9216_003654 [Gyalolechia sp. 2 TL-2023]
MEPISLALGIASLLAPVAKTIQLTSKYIRGVKEARVAARELLNVLEVFETTLQRLNVLSENDKMNSFSNTSVLATCTSACKNRLTSLQTTLQDNIKKPLKRLRWPLDAITHKNTLEDMRMFTQWIQLILTIDGLILLSKTSSEVIKVLSNQLDTIQHFSQFETSLKSTQMLLSDTHNMVAETNQAAKWKKVLDWISAAKPEQKHNEIRLRHLKGTGEWLLQNPSFKSWYCNTMPNHKSILWCYAGCHSKLPTPVTDLYEGMNEQGKTPQHQDLVQTLRSICQRQNRVYFVIDALDECEPRLRNKLIKILVEFKDFVSILVTSRDYVDDTTGAFDSWLKIKIEAHSLDLRIYILEEIDQSLWRDKIDQRFKEKVVERIIQRTGGIIGQIKEALDQLPRRLEGAFEDTIRRIQSQDGLCRELALKCMMWITYAKRPLTVDELGDALAITTRKDSTIVNADFRPPQEVLTYACLGMVVVDKESRVVRLAHYSIYEYLRGHEIPASPEADMIIANACIAYQTLEPFAHGCYIEEDQIVALLDAYPFFSYAARYWGDHVKGADDRSVNRAALHFLQNKQQLACSYQIRQYRQGRVEDYWHAGEAKSCNGLHVAAMFGLNHIAKELLHVYSVDTPTDMGTTALVNAASHGFPDLVQLCLDMNADPLKRSWEGTALHCAAIAGHTETMEVLLDAGVDVNLQDHYGNIPLHCAAVSGQVGAMRTLLRRGANVNHYREKGTILSEMINFASRPDVIQTLLDHRADPEIIGGIGLSPLRRAVLHGYEQISTMLLDHGAEVNAAGMSGMTALHTAAQFGQDHLVTLLLDRGAAIDSQCNDHITPLQLATEENRVRSIKLLLARGAKTELANDKGHTALHIAAMNNRTDILQVLIEAGANINAADADGMKVLGLATKSESWDAREFLLSHVKSHELDGWKSCPYCI